MDKGSGEGRGRKGTEKKGGKDEINSRVYGALKVAGISLTTWQTATVVGDAPSWREGRNRIDARSRMRPQVSARPRKEFLEQARERARPRVSYHSFALESGLYSRESSVNDSPVELLRNFTFSLRSPREKRTTEKKR